MLLDCRRQSNQFVLTQIQVSPATNHTLVKLAPSPTCQVQAIQHLIRQHAVWYEMGRELSDTASVFAGEIAYMLELHIASQAVAICVVHAPAILANHSQVDSSLW